MAHLTEHQLKYLDGYLSKTAHEQIITLSRQTMNVQSELLARINYAIEDDIKPRDGIDDFRITFCKTEIATCLNNSEYKDREAFIRALSRLTATFLVLIDTPFPAPPPLSYTDAGEWA